MCYSDGFEATTQLHSELHRVLKPGGRAITISIHTEEGISPFGLSAGFIASSCTLESARRRDLYYSLLVLDKADGLGAGVRSLLAALHPIAFANAVDRGYRSRLIAPESEHSTRSDDTVPSLNHTLHPLEFVDAVDKGYLGAVESDVSIASDETVPSLSREEEEEREEEPAAAEPVSPSEYLRALYQALGDSLH